MLDVSLDPHFLLQDCSPISGELLFASRCAPAGSRGAFSFFHAPSASMSTSVSCTVGEMYMIVVRLLSLSPER